MKFLKMLVFPSLAAAMLTPASAKPEQAPRMHAQTLDDLAPLPLPYDEKANAARDVAKASARAKAAHKLLLIDFGGNWCPDCRVLAGIMEQPDLRAYLDRHFEIVSVDIGRFDKNENVPQRYGFKSLEAVPAVFIVDPRTDKVLNSKNILALSDARTMSPQAVADWLAKWTR